MEVLTIAGAIFLGGLFFKVQQDKYKQEELQRLKLSKDKCNSNKYIITITSNNSDKNNGEI